MKPVCINSLGVIEFFLCKPDEWLNFVLGEGCPKGTGMVCEEASILRVGGPEAEDPHRKPAEMLERAWNSSVHGIQKSNTTGHQGSEALS